MTVKAILIALAIAVVGASAQTPPQAVTPNEPWPPAGVHKPGEPGLTLPVLVEKIQPAYTREGMRAGLQGFVVIAVVIGTDGTVERMRVIQSLDPAYGLDNEALRVVKLWRFTPGSKDGVPVPVAANFEIGFSLRNEPPPSTWPQPFIADGPDPNVVGKPQWTNTTIDTDALRYAISYPEGWHESRGGSPSALTVLSRATIQGVRSVAIGQPRKVPADLVLPMPIPQLQNFADSMRRRMSTRFRDTMGVGQLSVGGLWWTWLDLLVAPNALPTTLVLPNGDPGAEMRVWSFMTTVNAYEVTVSCFLISFPGLGDAVRDEELRAAGRDFRNILNLLTVSKKIASR